MIGNCNSEEPEHLDVLKDASMEELPESKTDQIFKDSIEYKRQLWTSQKSQTFNKLQNHLEESTKQEQNSWGRFWLMLDVLFTFCIPQQLKRHMSKRIQILAGITFFCFLILGYIALYFFYGRIEEQVFLTSTIPDKYVQCNETLISQSGDYVLSHDLQWRTTILDRNYLLSQEFTKNSPKLIFEPWLVTFIQYEANATKFAEDINQFVGNTNQFVATLDIRGQEIQEYGVRLEPDVIKILYNTTIISYNRFVRLLFHNQQINGTKGVAIISFNFQPQIFDNLNLQIVNRVITYNFSTLDNILDEFGNTFTYMGNAQSSNLLPYQTTYGYYQNFTNFDLNSWFLSTQNVLQILYSNLTTDDFKKIKNQIQTTQLEFRFDFVLLFMINYCYQIGIENCFNLNQESNIDNWFYLNEVISNNLLIFMKIWRPTLLDLVKENQVLIKNKKWLIPCNTLEINLSIGDAVQTQEGNFQGLKSLLQINFFALPSKKEGVVSALHFFNDYEVTFLDKKTGIVANTSRFNQSIYLGSVEFSNVDQEGTLYYENIINNRRFVKNFYDNTTSPPFTLSSGVYSCKVQNNPTQLERLANTHATGELISIALIFLLIIIFMLCVLPQLRTRQTSAVEELSDAVKVLFEQMAEIA